MPTSASATRRAFLAIVDGPCGPCLGASDGEGLRDRRGRRSPRWQPVRRGRVQVGPRHAGALRRSRSTRGRTSRRCRRRCSASASRRGRTPRRIKQRRHREAAARRRRDRRLLRQARARPRRLMPHGIDRICMTTANLSPAKIRRAMQLRKRSAGLHPGGGRRAQRPRPLGRGQGGGRGRRRRHRRRGGNAERHSRGRGRAAARQARGHAARAEAARPAVLRRRRPAHHRVRGAQGARARQHRGQRRHVSRR